MYLPLGVDRKNKLLCTKTDPVLKFPDDNCDRGQPYVFRLLIVYLL